MQHNCCTWILDGIHFKKLKDVSKSSKKLDEAISEMLNNLSDDKRRELAHEVYNLFKALNTPTLSELQKGNVITNFIKFIKNISFKNRKVFLELIFNFLRYSKI